MYLRHPQASVYLYPWSTLNGYSIDTPLTLDLNCIDILVDSWLIFNWCVPMSWSTLSRLLTECWPSVDWVSTGYWLGCKSRIVIEGINWHSAADVFSTHNPSSLQIKGNYRTVNIAGEEIVMGWEKRTWIPEPETAPLLPIFWWVMHIPTPPPPKKK